MCELQLDPGEAQARTCFDLAILAYAAYVADVGRLRGPVGAWSALHRAGAYVLEPHCGTHDALADAVLALRLRLDTQELHDSEHELVALVHRALRSLLEQEFADVERRLRPDVTTFLKQQTQPEDDLHDTVRTFLGWGQDLQRDVRALEQVHDGSPQATRALEKALQAARYDCEVCGGGVPTEQIPTLELWCPDCVHHDRECRRCGQLLTVCMDPATGESWTRCLGCRPLPPCDGCGGAQDMDALGDEFCTRCG